MEQTAAGTAPGKKADDDEISLIDLLAVLWRRKAMIIAITLVAAAGVVAFSVVSLVLPPETSPLPNEYTPTALMLINDSSSQGGGVASLLASSGLGNLASLAGIASAGSTFSGLATYLTGANTLLDAVADEFGLLARYKIDAPGKKAKSPRADSRRILKQKLTAAYDDTSGVFSISFTDTDPAFARRVVNYCVEYLQGWFDELGVDKNKLEMENPEKSVENAYEGIRGLEMESRRLEESVRRGGAGAPSISLDMGRIQMELEAQRQVYTQLKVQQELLKVAMAGEKPVFQVLELAEVPDRKSGPSRGLLCIVVALGAGFFSVFLAFVLNAVENVKKDPEAMAKLKGRRE